MKKFLTCLLLLIGTYLFSAPQKDVPQTITQPDGKVVQIFISGDEIYRFGHDKNGYTILKNESTGYYTYAKMENGKLVPSNLVVGKDSPTRDITPGLSISQDEYLKIYNERNKTKPATRANTNKPFKSGTLKNTVMFIYFTDQTPFSESEVASFDSKLNGETGNTVKNYFKENSYNKLEVTSYLNHTIQYAAPNNRDYYLNGSSTVHQKLCYDAVKWAIDNNKFPADLAVDGNGDGIVDNISFIVRGGTGEWASLLWPVRWWFWDDYLGLKINGKNCVDFNFAPETRADVATQCHELTHSCGAPDLYRYKTAGNPVSNWDNMGTAASTPMHNLAYLKYKYLGWIDEIPTITDGTYTLKPLNSSATENVYRFNSTLGNKEHFIVEYRKQAGFDIQLPGSGLIIYRIDEVAAAKNDGNAQGPPDEIYILRPGTVNSTSNTPGSAFFSSNSGRTEASFTTSTILALKNGADPKIALTNIGGADETISFTFKTLGFGNPPTNLSAVAGSGAEVNVSWSEPATKPLSYNVYRNGLKVNSEALTSLAYTDYVFGGGSTTYFVTAVYSEGESAPSNIVTVALPLSSLWVKKDIKFGSSQLYTKDFYPVNEQVVWAIGGSTTQGAVTTNFSVSSDGGNTWSAKTISGFTDLTIANISPVSATKAWAALYPKSTGGKVVVTNDGGASWTAQNAPFGSSSFLNVVHMFNENEGFCMGDPLDGYFEIYTTTDGGASWTRVPKANITGAPSSLPSGEMGTIGVYTTLGNTVWFGTQKGYVYKSTDKGLTWKATLVKAPSGKNFVGRITFSDENYGMISYNVEGGGFGVTKDGGATWDNLTVTDPISQAISAIPGKAGIFISMCDGNSSPGFFYTSNNGLSWKKIEIPNAPIFSTVNFINSTTGWAGSLYSAGGGAFLWQGGNIWKVSIDEDQANLNSILVNNYPNPFNPSTTISFNLNSNNFVNLSVYNVKGELVRNLYNQKLMSGSHSVNFDGTNLNSGVYYYLLKVDNQQKVGKMVLVK